MTDEQTREREQLNLIAACNPDFLILHIKENTNYNAELLARVFELAKERARALLAAQSPIPASPSGEDAAEQAAAPMAAFSEEQVYKVAIWLAKKDGVEDDDLHRLIWEGNPPEPWGEVWNRYEDDARELLAHIDAPLARDNEQATDVPVAVFAQPDGEDPMRFGDRSLDASVKRLTQAYCVQQPSPVPDQMALVWRFDIGRLRNDWLRLRSLTGSPASKAVTLPYVERFRESHGEGGGVYPDDEGDFMRYSDFVELFAARAKEPK